MTLSAYNARMTLKGVIKHWHSASNGVNRTETILMFKKTTPPPRITTTMRRTSTTRRTTPPSMFALCRVCCYKWSFLLPHCWGEPAEKADESNEQSFQDSRIILDDHSMLQFDGLSLSRHFITIIRFLTMKVTCEDKVGVYPFIIV